MSALERLESVNYDDAIAHGTAWAASESILIVPFWKPWFCRLVYEAAEEHGEFAPLPVDAAEYGTAPGQELRINVFSEWLFKRYKEHWANSIRYVVGDFYNMHYPFNEDRNPYRVPFILKYTMDTQTNMEPHHDFSLISMAMMLNGDYEGSYLWFPRQSWSNVGIPIGHAVIFPGQVSHYHQATELKSGTRYSMTGWIRGGDLQNVDP